MDVEATGDEKLESLLESTFEDKTVENTDESAAKAAAAQESDLVEASDKLGAVGRNLNTGGEEGNVAGVTLGNEEEILYDNGDEAVSSDEDEDVKIITRREKRDTGILRASETKGSTSYVRPVALTTASTSTEGGENGGKR